MTDIFIHSPFDAADLLDRILGLSPRISRPTTLRDHALRADKDGLRIGMVPEPAGSVAGHVISPDAAARARLDFAMAAFGAAPVPVLVDSTSVLAYVFEPGTAPQDEWPGDLATPERRLRLDEALVEIMDHFGRIEAAAMPGLLSGIGVRALARARGRATRSPSEIGSGFGPADLEPVASATPYAHFFAVEEHRLRHRRFDGRMSDTLDRAVFTSGDAVTVLPFDPRTRTVLLIEQFRGGPYARRDPQPWCLETVAGRCDRAEPPEVTARREAREEAGLELGRLERIAAYYPSPGVAAEYITAFAAEADLAAAGGVHGLAEEHEDIRSVVVSLDAAMAAVASGEVRNAPLLLSLFWLDRNADRLGAAWT